MTKELGINPQILRGWNSEGSGSKLVTGLELPLRRCSASRIRRWRPGSPNRQVGRPVQPHLPSPGRRRSPTHSRRTLSSLQPFCCPTRDGITNLPQYLGRSSLPTAAYPSSYLTNERNWKLRLLRPSYIRWLIGVAMCTNLVDWPMKSSRWCCCVPCEMKQPIPVGQLNKVTRRPRHAGQVA